MDLLLRVSTVVAAAVVVRRVVVFWMVAGGVVRSRLVAVVAVTVLRVMASARMMMLGVVSVAVSVDVFFVIVLRAEEAVVGAEKLLFLVRRAVELQRSVALVDGSCATGKLSEQRAKCPRASATEDAAYLEPRDPRCGCQCASNDEKA